MKENINKPQPQPVEKMKTMDIYNFEETSNIPPAPGEPLRRDGYKWIPEENLWDVDTSQCQTKRFQIDLKKNPNDVSLKFELARERHLDAFAKKINEKKEAERLAALNRK